MAHGFLQSFDPRLTVRSAGTEPAEKINEIAVKVMKEAGIDISSHKPQNVQRYITETWDYVITVCDQANETCPVFSGKVHHRLHLGFEDPSKASGTDEHILNEFIRIRNDIRKTFYELYIKNIKPVI
jgi:arsenate reductase